MVKKYNVSHRTVLQWIEGFQKNGLLKDSGKCRGCGINVPLSSTHCTKCKGKILMEKNKGNRPPDLSALAAIAPDAHAPRRDDMAEFERLASDALRASDEVREFHRRDAEASRREVEEARRAKERARADLSLLGQLESPAAAASASASVARRGAERRRVFSKNTMREMSIEARGAIEAGDVRELLAILDRHKEVLRSRYRIDGGASPEAPVSTSWFGFGGSSDVFDNYYNRFH